MSAPTKRFEYVSDKYGQGGGELNWYESVEEFERVMNECGMPCKLRFAGSARDGWGYRDEDDELVLVEHEERNGNTATT